MNTERLELEGKYIHLQLLGHRPTEGLAAAGDPLCQWSPVPQGKSEVMRYVETALSWKDAGTAASWTVDEGHAEVGQRFLNVSNELEVAEIIANEPATLEPVFPRCILSICCSTPIMAAR